MSKPSILHISTANTWRGGEQQLAYLLEELKEACNQHVVCILNSPMQAKCEAMGIAYTPVKKKSGIDFALAKAIARTAAKTESAIVHTHDAHGHTAAVLAARVFRLQSKLVVHRRVDFHIHSRFSKHFKYQFSGVAKIICVSKAIEAIMASDLGSNEKLVTIHSGVDLSRFTNKVAADYLVKAGVPDGKIIVGNVAAHAPHKDLFTFIRAAKRIIKQRQDVHFVSIGDGPSSAAIRKFSTAEGMDQHLTFLGYRKDVPALLSGFDLFLMTSKTEGLGTSILDAMAANIPIVATRAGGIPEMIIDGKTGRLAPVGNDEALCQAVLSVLSNGSAELIKGANKKLQAFTKEATANKTLTLYRSLLPHS